MKKWLSSILYITFAVLFIVGIVIKNKYCMAGGFLLAAVFYLVPAMIKQTKKH